LIVLSAAASQPERKRTEYEKAFGRLGVRRVSTFHQDRREDAEDRALLRAVDHADGVFFTGGNQLKLVTTLGGTSLEARLRERHLSGLHLGGTSAGASAMSAVMIARGQGRSSPRLSSIRLSPGLGMLPHAIVDQHFRERDRFGRLLAAVLCNPSMLGFGVDEDTAFVLDPAGRVSVVGNGTVTIVDGSDLLGTNLDELEEEEPAAFAGMRLHVLSQGWTFDVAQRRVELPSPDREERFAALREACAQGDRR
jgi:cyanophycinase